MQINANLQNKENPFFRITKRFKKIFENQKENQKIARLRPAAIAITLSDIALILLLCIQYIHSIAFIVFHS